MFYPAPPGAAAEACATLIGARGERVLDRLGFALGGDHGDQIVGRTARQAGEDQLAASLGERYRLAGGE